MEITVEKGYLTLKEAIAGKIDWAAMGLTFRRVAKESLENTVDNIVGLQVCGLVYKYNKEEKGEGEMYKEMLLMWWL